MPKLPSVSSLLGKAPGQAQGAWKIWSLFRSLNVSDIAEAAELPFHLALIGSEDHVRLLMARLALETAAPRDLGPSGPADISAYVSRAATAAEVPPGCLSLEAEPLTASETALAGAIAGIVAAHPELRISLARHVPAFPPGGDDAAYPRRLQGERQAGPPLGPARRLSNHRLSFACNGTRRYAAADQKPGTAADVGGGGLRKRSGFESQNTGASSGGRLGVRLAHGRPAAYRPGPRRHWAGRQRRGGIRGDLHGRPGGGTVLQHRPDSAGIPLAAALPRRTPRRRFPRSAPAEAAEARQQPAGWLTFFAQSRYNRAQFGSFRKCLLRYKGTV